MGVMMLALLMERPVMVCRNIGSDGHISVLCAMRSGEFASGTFLAGPADKKCWGALVGWSVDARERLRQRLSKLVRRGVRGSIDHPDHYGVHAVRIAR